MSPGGLSSVGTGFSEGTGDSVEGVEDVPVTVDVGELPVVGFAMTGEPAHALSSTAAARPTPTIVRCFLMARLISLIWTSVVGPTLCTPRTVRDR
jgi:hypothetical protein